ncbi:FAD/NAD(P)-binding protein [Labrys monachus]|uniref:NAD(P)/FAD-binding protein YdhS n=1 Tax=Labrys monachus TaxID=217067 RepID=A0ABU0FBD0_9HYPH|nr:FAD/NAD(P)-binding protein [Labrys monachus]MDQ0391350.1 putative NAD(P)/FAD-binding protein YdhS [Labrys monachus]
MPDSAALPSRQAPIVIVGGGLSGALLAARLLEAPGRRDVLVVDDAGPPGRGLAYSGRSRLHLVNANAGRMSADPADAAHFTRWLERFVRKGGWPEAPEGPASDLFAPRSVYGLYIQEVLAEAVTANARHGRRFEWVRARAADIEEKRDGLRVRLSDGSALAASVAVLATGIFSRSRATDGARSSRRLLDPWAMDAGDVPGPEARIAIIGAGLTMVDAVVSLQSAGYRGAIDVVSRHGLRPHPRRLPPDWIDFLAGRPHLATARALTRAVRAECEAAMAAGEDWQGPLDTVRAHVGRLWGGASDRERRRFLRHVRPFWESHHHRSPPAAGSIVDGLAQAGRLHHLAGEVRAIDVLGKRPALTIRLRGTADTSIRVYDAVVVSSGVDYDWRQVGQALPQNLLRGGTVRPGPLGLGIDATADYRVVGRGGVASDRLFALGPPLRGLWWESTAVADIARQACELAAALAATASALASEDRA